MALCDVMSYNFSLIFLLSVLLRICGGILLSELYPFNSTYGDTQTPRIDDGGSDKITLTKRFKFFGKNKTSVYVNNNGILTFENKLEEYKPQSFPSKENRSIIAPFWADVNTEHVGGTVWFRQTLEEDLLERASAEVRSYFLQQRRFTATWMFIATWEKVGYYGASREGKNKRNTFQSILITDEIDSYVIFNYNTIEWTTGSNSGGNAITGLGGNPAQVGFNAGDSIHYYSVEGAFTAAVVNITLTSNVNIPGKWVFQVDGDIIVDNKCKTASGSAVEIRTIYRNNGAVEGSETEIVCSVTIAPEDKVASAPILIISAYNITAKMFVQIALFISNTYAGLTSSGEYLKDRVNLNSSILSTSSEQATVIFKYITSDDETEYKCTLTIFSSAGQFILESDPVNISVQGFKVSVSSTLPAFTLETQVTYEKVQPLVCIVVTVLILVVLISIAIIVIRFRITKAKATKYCVTGVNTSASQHASINSEYKDIGINNTMYDVNEKKICSNNII